MVLGRGIGVGELGEVGYSTSVSYSVASSSEDFGDLSVLVDSAFAPEPSFEASSRLRTSLLIWPKDVAGTSLPAFSLSRELFVRIPTASNLDLVGADSFRGSDHRISFFVGSSIVIGVGLCPTAGITLR